MTLSYREYNNVYLKESKANDENNGHRDRYSKNRIVHERNSETQVR